jgi:hypothetical protein
MADERADWVNALTNENDLVWITIPLANSASIDVSLPYVRDGVYVPVRAKEMWSKAVLVRGYPLTRAVADQAHLFAVTNGIAVVFQGQWPFLTDYRKFAATLDSKFSYKSGYPQAPPLGLKKMVSGGHKYWLLSAAGGKDPRAINYGFYTKDPKIKDGGLGGFYLYGKKPDPSCFLLPNVWFLQQTLGGAHDAMEWDYSQLCQFMKNFKVGGSDQSMADAITDKLAPGHDAIWDESRLLDKKILPW